MPHHSFDPRNSFHSPTQPQRTFIAVDELENLAPSAEYPGLLTDIDERAKAVLDLRSLFDRVYDNPKIDDWAKIGMQQRVTDLATCLLGDGAMRLVLEGKLWAEGSES